MRATAPALLRYLRRDGVASTGGTSPVVVDDMLFVYDPQGALRVDEAATGHQIVAFPCGPGRWNSPTIADRRVALAEGNWHGTIGVPNIWRVKP